MLLMITVSIVTKSSVTNSQIHVCNYQPMFCDKILFLSKTGQGAGIQAVQGVGTSIPELQDGLHHRTQAASKLPSQRWLQSRPRAQR